MMDQENRINGLSPRELQIAQAYGSGASYRKIAEQLYIAPATVRTHLASIYRKLGISTKIDLFRLLEDVQIESAEMIVGSVQVENSDRPAIAVLPFRNLSGESEQKFIADGIAEYIFTVLSRSHAIFVVNCYSSHSYKGEIENFKQIGRQAGARYVVEGAVQLSEDRVRITTQLIDAATGEHFWAERFDGILSNIFTLQDEIARKIAIEVSGKATYGQYATRWQRDTDNFEAWSILLHAASEYLRFSKDGCENAIRFSQEALDLDPEYGSAHAVMGWGYLSLGRLFSDDPTTAYACAMACADKALDYDNVRPHALNLMANNKLHEHLHREAIALSRKALSLAPNSAELNIMLSSVLLYSGQIDESSAQCRRAMSNTPVNPGYFVFNLVECHRIRGELDLALELVHVLVKEIPDSSIAHVRMAAILALMGRISGARESLQTAISLDPGISLKRIGHSQPYRHFEHSDSVVRVLRAVGLRE